MYFCLTLINTCNDCAVSRGHQELQVVTAAIQTVLSIPVSVATALKGIQKTLGKALPFKVGKDSINFTFLSEKVFAYIHSTSVFVMFTAFLMVLSVLSNMVVQPKRRK